MNRIVLVSIATAAVLVTGAGAVTAAAALGDDDRPAPASPPTAHPAPRRAAEAPPVASTPSVESSSVPTYDGGLFWATASQIHDGEKVVDYQVDDGVRPDAVWRSADGYVVAVRTGEATSRAWTVTEDGEVDPLFDYAGAPGDADVSADGTRMVALDVERTAYAILDLATGQVSDTVSFGIDETDVDANGLARFGGDRVYTTWHDGEVPHVVSSVPGSTERDPALDLTADLVGAFDVSPDGSRFAGNLYDGTDPAAVPCAWVGAENAADARVTDCDTMFTDDVSFSADGASVLGVPADTEGFGPTALHVLSAEGDTVEVVTAPEWTIDAVMGEAGEITVLGAVDQSSDGTVLYSCYTGDAGCEQVAVSADPVVLGTP